MIAHSLFLIKATSIWVGNKKPLK